MSIKDQLKALERQKQDLLNAEKKKQLEAINRSIAALAEIGVFYRLVEEDKPTKAAPTKPAQPKKRSRRKGIRSDVLAHIANAKNGMNRAQLIIALGLKGDKQGEVSVSNALAALKRAGQITSKEGTYLAAKK